MARGKCFEMLTLTNCTLNVCNKINNLLNNYKKLR